MNRIISGLIIFSTLLLCFCSCSAQNNEKGSLKFERPPVVVSEKNNGEDLPVFNYDNSADVGNETVDLEPIFDYNRSRRNESAASVANDYEVLAKDDFINRYYNGQCYSIVKAKSINNKNAYELVFWDKSGIALCLFRIERLYNYDDLKIEIGKTTIDDLKKYFPYEDYYYDKSESEVHFDLQFLGEEKTLQFKNKNDKYILSNIYTPEPSLVVSKSILPKDLELITK